MEASVRLFHSPGLNRHLLPSSHRFLNLPLKLSPPPFSSRNPNPSNAINVSFTPSHRPFPPRSVPFSSLSLPPSNPVGSLLSLSLSLSLSFSQIFHSQALQERLDSIAADPKDGPFHLWDRDGEVADGGDPRFCGEGGAIWTVVLLGWLGAEHKHLKRYAEIYKSRGIQSVRFVVPLSELLGLDLGRRVEERIAGLACDLASWCSETEKDGRERNLLFHTFSNTGWLTYGAILDNLKSRSDVIKKIKGCVVDSGPAPELSSRVWAAGFCAALLKKRSSLTQSVESTEGDKLDSRSSLSESIVLSVLKMFFSIVLRLPDVNRRLSRIISVLSKNQPPCPQLYLYSSADKVVPARSVEHFIQEQKALGRNIHSHDFGSSPHVDHFRSFPHIYSAKVGEYLQDCCSQAVS